ncbi:MAG: 2-oxo acid dehydrogenase subunit E2 [Pseudomonadota bacterium]
MPIEIKMPALSPTMEEGTLARWLVKVGDEVAAGDIMAEIETDKATMEFEAVDEGRITHIVVKEGTENVQVGVVIATLAEDGEDMAGDMSAPTSQPSPASITASTGAERPRSGPSVRKLAKASGIDLASVKGTGPKGNITKQDVEAANETEGAGTAVFGRASTSATALSGSTEQVNASPLARRIATHKGLDLSSFAGSGANGRIIMSDIEKKRSGATTEPAKQIADETKFASKRTPRLEMTDIPYEVVQLNNVRKVIARRLTEAKHNIPHIYLTVDVQLDQLLKLRSELNASLEPDGVKLSVNDLIIKALARALQREPQCNVSFQGDVIHQYSRQDISVAVAAPSGLITPIIKDAGRKGLADISKEMRELADKAREGKLQPHEYQGGTASLSNLGMFGTKEFHAVINPPQAMILAVGAGVKRSSVIDGSVEVATVMSATGSFDHRAIDGVDGALLLKAFQQICENPLALIA